MPKLTHSWKTQPFKQIRQYLCWLIGFHLPLLCNFLIKYNLRYLPSLWPYNSLSIRLYLCILSVTHLLIFLDEWNKSNKLYFTFCLFINNLLYFLVIKFNYSFIKNCLTFLTFLFYNQNIKIGSFYVNKKYTAIYIR